MYGLEKITSMCGLGCKVFWHPWTQTEKLPYDAVLKDDNDVTDLHDPVTSEPQKPIWTELKQVQPIVKNKSASVGNLRTSSGYELVASNSMLTPPSVSEKRNSSADLNVSAISNNKSLLNNSTRELSGSSASLAEQKLQISQLVTTV